MAIAGAVVGALILHWIATYATRGVVRQRHWFVWAVTLFPFACLAWGGAVFVFQAAVNVLLLHRDVGIGDGFDCPLPNGYALSFIDVTDYGTVYNPKNRPVWSDIRENAVDDVRAMQLAGRYILGGSDSKRTEHFGQNTGAVDRYFLLDTQTGKRTDFDTYDALRNAALQVSVRTNLVPIDSIYRKYRFTWFDGFAGLLLIGPPAVGAAALLRWILRLRLTRDLFWSQPSAGPATPQ